MTIKELGFNGHPPLGVNATDRPQRNVEGHLRSFNGHPPLGVNATSKVAGFPEHQIYVSMGTHPWG